jgi:hypothetical protein
VPLGGSLRASRAAQLARPHGPLAAVDLADGRALLVEPSGSAWVAIARCEAAPTEELRVPEAEEAAPAPARRRRLGTALVLAAALGAAAVALATGFSGAPPPAVAGPTVRADVPSPPAAPVFRPAARGGPAAALAPRLVPPPPPPVARAVAPAPPPVQPALPELPSAPAL